MRSTPARIPAVLCLVAISTILAACESGGGSESSESAAHDTPSTAAVASDTSATRQYVVFADYVNPEDSLPRLRYRDDGLVSINDRCAVRKVKLNPRMPAAYVNGRPVGFC